MKESDLDRKLKGAGVPEWPADHWDTFPTLVRARLGREDGEADRERAGFRFSWALAAAFACVAILLSLGYWHRTRSGSDTLTLLQNGEALREMMDLFPNRVRAIEEDKTGVHLTLSDYPDVPVSTPYWIRICDGKQCRAVVTFSGQSLRIDGQEVEVLVDAQGSVLLVGDQFVWSSAGPNPAPDNLRIQARPVSTTVPSGNG